MKSETRRKYTFGPVPSRRLGLSLGVNNIPHKYCSYSCVYCQAGKTIQLTIERRKFYDPQEIVSEVIEVLDSLEKKPDYITFVPNGEPTLDAELGKEAELIKNSVEIPLAILTNSSLLYRDDVQNDLMWFDLVSIKVDTVFEETFRKLNRPHKSLSINKVLDGIKDFTDKYRGRVIIETMLVSEINTNTREYTGIAEFIKDIRFDKVYIMIPIRPPTEKWVKPPSPQEALRAYKIISGELGSSKVELMMFHEPSNFIISGSDFVNEILRIISVHPLKLEYFEELAREKGFDPDAILNKITEEKLADIVEYKGQKFLIKHVSSR